MSDLSTLLPPNAQKVEYDLEQFSARLQGMADPVQGLWDAEVCPEHLLPYLAWAFSVDDWEADWDARAKRALLADVIGIHRQKGTLGSVKRALGAIGFRLDVQEWFQYGGAPHTCRIDAYHSDLQRAGLSADADTLQKIRRYILNVKPVRSHFELRVGITVPSLSGFHTGARARLRSEAIQKAQPGVQTTHLQIAPLGRVIPALASRRNASVRASGVATSAASASGVIANHRLRIRTNCEHHLRLPVITGASNSPAQLHSTIRLTTKSQINHTVTERSA